MRVRLLMLFAMLATAICGNCQHAANVPLVYDVENTGAALAVPDMLPADQLPEMKELPDALEGVSTFADWARRRNEIGAMIQHYGIGKKPTVDKESINARMNGDTLVVDVTVEGETLTLRSTIRYPKKGNAPYALMIGTSGISLPKKIFEERPIATMVFHEAQVNDYSQWRKHKERGEHNIDRLYPQLKDNGAYSHWAWGLSRLIDGLQLLGEENTKIDTRRIGVTGCSYAGKMALYCGAFDERVALTIAQEPGGGGAAAWRASHGKQDVESLEHTDYHWFLESMRANFSGDNVYRLPYDQHELCAMVCPRALLLLGNPDYKWLADEAMEVSANAAHKVWQRFGIADRMAWSIVGGHKHCQLHERQYAIVEEYIDRFLVPLKALSPNGKLSLSYRDNSYVVEYQGKHVMNISAGGIGNKAGGKRNLSFVHHLKADYTMLAGKRLHCTNEANEYAVVLDGRTTLVWRLYNDGIAFRYELTGLNSEQIGEEHTAFIIPEGRKRWIQPWTEPYEAFFPMAESGNQKKRHWGYPALVEAADSVFALITETDISRRQSASSLRNDRNVEEYRVCPEKNDLLISGHWHTPWRTMIVGSLADVVESTLVTDVSEPCRLTDTQWIKPGVVSWIYWAHNHGSNNYDIICQYVDMAERLKLPYVLIDAEWDEMKNGKTIEDAVAYAKSKGVRPMIWYNSSVGWINGAPGPKFRLNKPEDREKEFAWCEKLGVAGVKIDFFSGDNQKNMDYYIELMECAARHHLLINFHGATIPRGWQRTYPNMLTMEAVYGAEWYNNVPTFTSKAAAHNATLPFTRNVIGPMDYTPCAFSDSQHPHITSDAHELALTVLFESGLQHLADRPESYYAQPSEVQQFLSELPAVWDETRLLSGYPGNHVVMARRSGNTWYVAGINGTDEPISLSLAVEDIVGDNTDATVFADGKGLEIKTVKKLPKTIKCKSRGGFVMKIKE